MDDIARLAGVSKSTVSRALSDSPLVNEETKKKIRELAKQHHYIIDQRARNFRLQQTNTIGVAFPFRHDKEQHVSDPFFLDLLGHLADGLVERGYDLLLPKPKFEEDDWLEKMTATRRVDGLILIGQGVQHDMINEFAKHYEPLVVWGAEIEGQRYVTVGSDNVLGGYKATKYLIEQGRRNIAFFGNITPPEFNARYRGYVKAHKEAGVAIQDDLLISSPLSNDIAFETMSRALNHGPEMDAIVAASDVIAISAVQALKRAGKRVPQDVAVVGYDDIPLAAYVEPPLTTIRQDTEQAAKLLLDRLFAKMEGKKTSSAKVGGELIIRASSE